VYDKVSAEASVSRDGAGTGIIPSLFRVYWREAAATSLTQKTFTVVKKCDRDNLAELSTYHARKFSWTMRDVA
jgi:hypothetical protein